MESISTMPMPSPVRAISALVLRDVSLMCRRSIAGWLWAIAKPFGVIAVLAIVLTTVSDAPPLGQSTVMFCVAGYLPFMMFREISTKTANAVRVSGPLLTQPAATPLDAIVARYTLTLVIQLLAFTLILATVEVFFATGTLIDPLHLALALALTAQLAAGIGVLNCALVLRFPWWERVWNVGTPILFLISGVMFLVEDIPGKLQSVALLNPLLHITALFRAALYPAYGAAFASPLFVALLGVICLCAGLLMLRITSREAASS